MNPQPGPVPCRRDFLQVTGAAALGLTQLPNILSAAPVPRTPQQPDPFGGFTVGIQSYSFRNFKLEQALERTRDLGLRYIELYRGHVPLNSTAAQIKAVLGLCKQYQVTPIAFGVENFTKDHAFNRAKFVFARSLGVRYLSPTPTRPVSTAWTSWSRSSTSASPSIRTGQPATRCCIAGIRRKSSWRRSSRIIG